MQPHSRFHVRWQAERAKARARRLLRIYDARLGERRRRFVMAPRAVGRVASVRGVGCNCMHCRLVRRMNRADRRRSRHEAMIWIERNVALGEPGHYEPPPDLRAPIPF